MGGIKWEQRLETGNQTVDRQHMHLVSMMNQVAESVAEGTGTDLVKNTWLELLHYVGSHFTDEEMLMESCGYEGLELHRLQHHRLAERTRCLAVTCWEGDVVTEMDLVNFFYDWWIQHILGSDLPMVEYVRSMREELEPVVQSN